MAFLDPTYWTIAEIEDQWAVMPLERLAEHNPYFDIANAETDVNMYLGNLHATLIKLWPKHPPSVGEIGGQGQEIVFSYCESYRAFDPKNMIHNIRTLCELENAWIGREVGNFHDKFSFTLPAIGCWMLARKMNYGKSIKRISIANILVPYSGHSEAKIFKTKFEMLTKDHVNIETLKRLNHAFKWKVNSHIDGNQSHLVCLEGLQTWTKTFFNFDDFAAVEAALLFFFKWDIQRTDQMKEIIDIVIAHEQTLFQQQGLCGEDKHGNQISVFVELDDEKEDKNQKKRKFDQRAKPIICPLHVRVKKRAAMIIVKAFGQFMHKIIHEDSVKRKALGIDLVQHNLLWYQVVKPSFTILQDLFTSSRHNESMRRDVNDNNLQELEYLIHACILLSEYIQMCLKNI